MKKKLAIIVDWENLRSEIEKAQSKNNINNQQCGTNVNYVNYNISDHIVYFLNSFVQADEELCKILFYTAEPYPKHPLTKQIKQFLDEISQSPYFALRLGKLVQRGSSYVQKQVDMLMGLDIAHLSYNKIVDRILVFSKDTDIIPALKCARTCGIQVKIASLKDGSKLNKGLTKHSDLIVEKFYVNIKP